MANLVLKDLNKVFDNSFAAVKDFNLEIKDKEFIILVGPSGCGKSTSLRMIAGLEEATSGEIYIDNKLVNNIEPKDRDIAMVFQNYALYPHMNVYDNISFGLKQRKVPKEIIEEKVCEVAKILEIEELLKRKPKQLSGGQRQRIALGRAIVRDPKVFLMDEPLSNLDAKLRVQMRAEISKLHNRLQTTFIYVTHDQTEAMTMGDRIVIMNEGVIQQVASPREIYNQPQNMFVAGFIGSPQINFIKGVVVKEGDEIAIEFAGGRFSVDERSHSFLKNYPKNKEIVCGVRPEHIEVCENREESYLSAEVDVVEQMGSENYIYLKADGFNLIVRTDPDVMVQTLDRIYLSFNLAKIHYFDGETKERITEETNYPR
ncbi:sn-glycerol-3-phosphate ABC transporter ATP-binding protein UgpC [Clostridia bacterium]|nr:sn-glycerol-3-phosphate ABC transporter ATP-binding protein UgpC [Clostridia bacterium]